ncbi:ComEA family DNA-binding protein [Rhizohabitans arisaemae]|uniref:ComEA family DNA-binding protein n=1 Tax=Rhizohabitans arisaemae TaxID=2720610 RepID=UPI0024B1EC90|nr:ComEA family DNA-binding protein [Rhizohabitans arisaemae]
METTRRAGQGRGGEAPDPYARLNALALPGPARPDREHVAVEHELSDGDRLPPSGRLIAEPAPPRGPRVPLIERSARFDLGGRGLRVLVLAGVAASVVAGVYAWRSAPTPEPVPVAVPSADAGSRSGPVPGEGPSPSATASVFVHVIGGVRRPGVIALPVGARVRDAVDAAGGVRAGSRAGTLNLARRVVDGEQIDVGAKQPAVTAGGNPGTGPEGVLDLNLATPEQLETLPGLGAVLVKRIVDFRIGNGGFRSVEQLRQISGIGERKYAEIKDKVRV